MGHGSGSMIQGTVKRSAAQVIGMDRERLPLVSVGIPTFNRPDGLRRTLRLICNQTYPNLEILVSDNASPGSETEEVVRDFATTDERIKYFRQPENIGAIANFRFVLAEASGDYFMWAADDDEWDPRFIETCVAKASPSCSVMTKFNTIFRTKNLSQENPIPQLSPDASLFQNVENYLAIIQPSLFYGLHPRKALRFVLKGRYFDFHDCYVVLRLILEGNFLTINEVLYNVGIDAPSYVIKYADPDAKRFKYWPFFWRSCLALLKCSRLSFRERVQLLRRFKDLVLELRRFHEQNRKAAA
jgi:glycosyltransferase involved in cell wall biosynthesis